MRQEGLCAANTSVCFVGLMRFLAEFDYSGEVLWPNKQSHRELVLIISDVALNPKQHSLPGWKQNQGKANIEWIQLAPSYQTAWDALVGGQRPGVGAQGEGTCGSVLTWSDTEHPWAPNGG